MADISNLSNFLEDVADAIRTKKETTEKIPAANFDTEILSIVGGLDTSDATATADDIINPQTAYVDGEKITGNIMPEYENISTSTYNIPIASSDIVKYVGENYVTSVSPSGIIKVWKLQENNTFELLTTYNINDIQSFNSSDISRGDISAYSASDNNIKFVFPRTAYSENPQVIYYFSFDCSSKTINYISNYTYRLNDMYGQRYMRVKFPNFDANHLVFFSNQSSDDATHYVMLSIDATSITQIQEFWSQRYGHYPTEIHFINNDKTLCLTTGDNDSDDEVTFMFYFSAGYTLNKTQKTSTSQAHTIFSENGSCAAIGNEIYTSQLDTSTNTITIGNSIGTVPYDVVDIIENNYILTYNSNDTMYNIYNVNGTTISESLYNNTDISVNKDRIGFLNIYNNATTELYSNASLISGDNKKLVGVNIKGQPYYNTSDIAVASNNVLNRVKFINRSGIQYGSMPNNGELNYEVSTSEQTIPEGYTSGGTVAASPLTQDDYNSCLDLSYNILRPVYEEVELLHINSSKTINFGITAKQSNTYKLKFKDNTVNNWEAYIGISGVGNVFMARNDGNDDIENSNIEGNLSTIPTTTPGEVSFTFASVANGHSILSGTTQNSTAVNADYDFYYLQVYSGDELINNFVPVREVATNKIGLLDKVTNTFIEY